MRDFAAPDIRPSWPCEAAEKAVDDTTLVVDGGLFDGVDDLLHIALLAKSALPNPMASIALTTRPAMSPILTSSISGAGAGTRSAAVGVLVVGLTVGLTVGMLLGATVVGVLVVGAAVVGVAVVGIGVVGVAVVGAADATVGDDVGAQRK